MGYSSHEWWVTVGMDGTFMSGMLGVDRMDGIPILGMAGVIGWCGILIP